MVGRVVSAGRREVWLSSRHSPSARTRRLVVWRRPARRPARRLRSRARPQPTPTSAHGRGRRHRRQLRARQGRRQRRVREDVLRSCSAAVLGAMDLLVQQSPQLFDKSDESGTGTGQYRVLDKEAYLNGLVANLAAAGYCAQRDPGRRQLRADPGQERERLLRELRRARELRPHAARQRQLLRDLHARILPGGPRRPAARGQRLRLSVSRRRSPR